MKKFAANYLISENGVFLKNGVLVVGEDGLALQYIDTKGDLRETEQLIFYNGVLMTGCMYIKTNAATKNSEHNQKFRLIVLQSLAGLTSISIHNLIDLGKQVQFLFPEMKIPEILNEISSVLLTSGGYTKENIVGTFLLKEVDLLGLRFTPKSRLKKIA